MILFKNNKTQRELAFINIVKNVTNLFFVLETSTIQMIVLATLIKNQRFKCANNLKLLNEKKIILKSSNIIVLLISYYQAINQFFKQKITFKVY